MIVFIVDCPADGSTCYFEGTTRKKLLEKDMQNDLSITLEGPSFLWPGVSNYVLQISSSKDEEEPVAYLYFLDSGGGSYPEVISAAQSRWFQQESKRLNPDGRYQPDCLDICLPEGHK